MTRPDISASMQDYLEAILELSDRDGNARVTDIAASLSIAKASVSQTISKLKEMGLVTQESYGPVNLTADGKDWAIKIRHQHRILRRFLIEILGVKPEIAEQEACLMEHAVSAQTIAKLVDFLEAQASLD